MISVASGVVLLNCQLNTKACGSVLSELSIYLGDLL